MIDARTIRRFISAMSDECLRNARGLRVPGYPRPYYVSYLLRDVYECHLWGRLGNLNEQSNQSRRHVFCDVRVGSYRFDQVAEGGLDDHDGESEALDHVDMPIGNDTDALKYHLWKLTDVRYREAVRQYLARRSQNISFVDPNEHLSSFRRADPIDNVRFRGFPKVDVNAWKRFVVQSSRVVKRYPEVKNSWVEMRVRDTTRVFVNSEGSRIVDQSRICELSCDLWLLTQEGEGVATRVAHITPSTSALPDLRTFQLQIKERVELLNQLAAAPTIKSYAGPVLLAPGPAGILFHEVLGHRLEGSRLLSTREGQTFKRDLGKRILPESFTVYDDPTLKRSKGVQLVGGYRFDDEGSHAQRAPLIDRGKLVGFLAGRQPVLRGRTFRGNGHARSEYYERPISRMSNLVVEVNNGMSHAELKARFIDEIKKQKVPFGIMVLDGEGGETATDTYDFQAFMGQIALAVQVWADGRENLVRGVNFVGTPLSALRNVIAVGDTQVCENAFCGAESGLIPVSTTCPAMLLRNLELQASDQRKFAQYVLPMPYEKAALSPTRRRSKKPRKPKKKPAKKSGKQKG